MITSEQIIKAYREVALEVPHAHGSPLRYVAIVDIRRKLNVRRKTIINGILNLHKYQLGKAPAALKEERYLINNEEWVFIQIPN